jgi:hypothetical protein
VGFAPSAGIHLKEIRMATVVNPYHERRTSERRRIAYPGLFARDGMKVSWGGILGGVLVAVGVLVLLMALGVAVGISAVDPASTDAAKVGTGAGIWAGVSLLIALFLGGFVSTRIGATYDRQTSFFSGFLVWVVSVVLVAYMAASGASSLTGSAFNLFASASGQQKEQAAATIQEKAQELQQKAPELQQRAQEAKPQATKAAWLTFGSLLLSLLAALIGSAVGRRRDPAQPTSRGT